MHLSQQVAQAMAVSMSGRIRRAKKDLRKMKRVGHHAACVIHDNDGSKCDCGQKEYNQKIQNVIKILDG